MEFWFLTRLSRRAIAPLGGPKLTYECISTLHEVRVRGQLRVKKTLPSLTVAKMSED